MREVQVMPCYQRENSSSFVKRLSGPHVSRNGSMSGIFLRKASHMSHHRVMNVPGASISQVKCVRELTRISAQGIYFHPNAFVLIAYQKWWRGFRPPVESKAGGFREFLMVVKGSWFESPSSK